MQMIFSVLLRLVLLAAGLVFAASLLFVAVLLLALWGLRAVWARLTGQPVVPFVMRVDPRTGFGQVFRGQARVPPVAAGDPGPSGRVERLPDIEDVEIKPPRDEQRS
jgi:hypothetical protein